MRQKNLRRIIFAHLNVNSLRKKFDGLVDQIQRNVDILVISETKLDESPSEDQFKIPGIASPFRRDQNKFWGREDITSEVISKETLTIEEMFIELNFWTRKWWLSCSYSDLTLDGM